MPDLVELVAEEAGAEIARIEREFGLRVEAMLADCRASVSAVALEAERTIGELRVRLATVADGRDGAAGERGLDGPEGPTGPVGAPGDPGPAGDRGERGFGLDDFDTEVIDEGRTLLLKFVRGDVAETHEIMLPIGPQGPQGAEGAVGPQGERGVEGERGAQGEAGPLGAAGANGTDGAPGVQGERGQPGETGAAGERGLEGAPGKLPLVRAWSDEVHYEGDVVTHGGATYQALRDTGRQPGSDDWACIAERGVDGQAAQEFDIRSTWSADEAYRRLSVVALNGASFVARRDDPGPCPGEGWQLMSGQGKRGAPGEKGDKGDMGLRGPAGPAITKAVIADDGLLTLTNADGSVVTCDFYPVLIRIAQ